MHRSAYRPTTSRSPARLGRTRRCGSLSAPRRCWMRCASSCAGERQRKAGALADGGLHGEVAALHCSYALGEVKPEPKAAVVLRAGGKAFEYAREDVFRDAGTFVDDLHARHRSAAHGRLAAHEN